MEHKYTFRLITVTFMLLIGYLLYVYITLPFGERNPAILDSFNCLPFGATEPASRSLNRH
jgi:hypothetical protein